MKKLLENLNPYRVLQDAIRAVPALRYALGVLGVVSVIAIVAAWKIDFKVAVFGVLVALFLMVCLLLFARLVAIAPKYFLLPAIVMLWFVLILFIATFIVLFTATVFQMPESFYKFLYGGRGHFTSLADLQFEGYADYYPCIIDRVSETTANSLKVHHLGALAQAQTSIPQDAKLIKAVAQWNCNSTESHRLVPAIQHGSLIVASDTYRDASGFPFHDWWGEIQLTVTYSLPVVVRDSVTKVPLTATPMQNGVEFSSPAGYGPLKAVHVRLQDFKTLDVIDEVQISRRSPDDTNTITAASVSSRFIAEMTTSELRLKFK